MPKDKPREVVQCMNDYSSSLLFSLAQVPDLCKGDAGDAGLRNRRACTSLNLQVRGQEKVDP